MRRKRYAEEGLKIYCEGLAITRVENGKNAPVASLMKFKAHPIAFGVGGQFTSGKNTLTLPPET